MLHAEALALARMLETELRPACVDTLIVGGVRRGKADVHDIEILLLPRFDTDLFGDVVETYGELDLVIASLIRRGVIAFDRETKRDGMKHKRFVLPGPGIVFEIFVSNERNFGNNAAIRTGDEDFTTIMVTQKAAGGMMPPFLKQAEGYLWRSVGTEWVPNPCRTEADYFAAIGVAVVPPSERCKATAEALAKRVKLKAGWAGVPEKCLGVRR